MYWIVKGWIHSLFPPIDEYEISSVVHFFAKRLRYSRDQVMKLDIDERKRLFEYEQAIIEQEKREAEGK